MARTKSTTAYRIMAISIALIMLFAYTPFMNADYSYANDNDNGVIGENTSQIDGNNNLNKEGEDYPPQDQGNIEPAPVNTSAPAINSGDETDNKAINVLEDDGGEESGEPSDDPLVWDGTIDTEWYNVTDTTFTISAAAELAGLAEIVNGTAENIDQDSFLGKTIILGEDLDLNDLNWTRIGTALATSTYTRTSPTTGMTQSNLTSINEATALPFNGTFDGNGKSIVGLNVDTGLTTYGFFGYLGSSGTVKDFTLEGTVKTSNNGGDAVGGLVGFNRGTIDHYTGRVNVVAGVTPANFSSGTGVFNVGGIAGFNDGLGNPNAKIIYSSSTADVKGFNKVGGLVGQNAGLIESSFSSGTVDQTISGSGGGTGGIAGRNGNNNTAVEAGIIRNCYSDATLGNAHDQRWLGGITGFCNNPSFVYNSYFIGEIRATPYADYAGIIARSDKASINYNSYALDTVLIDTQRSTAIGNTGILKTAAEMKTQDFVDAINAGGRAFVMDYADDAAVNNGYPILRGVQYPDTATFTNTISIDFDPEYIEDETLELSDIKAFASYSDSTKTPVLDLSVSPSAIVGRALTEEDDGTEIDITASFNGVDEQKSFTLEVESKAMTNFELLTNPQALTYAIGDNFIIANANFRITYSNGKTENINTARLSEVTCTPTAIAADTTAITASYTFRGVTKSVEIPITVLDSTAPEQVEGVYQISTANDIRWFAQEVGYKGNNNIDAILLNNIDLSECTDIEPIGYSQTTTRMYLGTFDGNGKKLTVDIDVSDARNHGGIFGYIGAGSVVKNLTVDGSLQFTSTYASSGFGGIVGYSLGTVSNCTNYATISSKGSTGGIVGANSTGARIEDCVNYGIINSTGTLTGGITGQLGPGKMADCVNNGEIISTTGNVGGISGGMSGASTMTDVVNNGAVSGTYNVGGVIGSHAGTVDVSIISGAVNNAAVSASAIQTINSYGVGGLAGQITTGTLTKSYNAGTVNGATLHVGGVAGVLTTANGKIIDCYNTATVKSTATSDLAALGGIVGSIGTGAANSNVAGTVKNSYNSGALTYPDTLERLGGAIGWRGNLETNLANNYYLDSVATEDAATTSISLSSEDLKTAAILLGTSYSTNVEGGYPVLNELLSEAPTKGEQAAPAAPTVDTLSDTSITLAAPTGVDAGKTVEYRLGDNGTWTENPEFTGLTPDTDYVFYARLAESDDYFASAKSQALTAKTLEPTPTIVDVTSIQVTAEGGASSISEQSGTLQLSAEVLPEDATDKSVTWSITSGSEFANISSTGLLTATNNGTVIVRATANDGTEISSEITITISGQVNSYWDGDKYYENGKAVTGWKQIDDIWYYFNTTTENKTVGWLKSGNSWYYMNEDGEMQTGLIDVAGKKYMLNASGIMQTGWIQSDGIWYYFSDAAQVGWLKLGSSWYYMNEDGEMQTGILTIDGKKYAFADAPSGKMVTGWVKSDDIWYYFNNTAQVGWLKVGSSWYYMNSEGEMQTGFITLGTKKYALNASGIMQTGWIQSEGKWYYYNDAASVGWLKVGSNWYYMNEEGEMQTGWQSIGGKWYYLASSGVMQTAWQSIGGKWYYFASGGAMQTGWLQSGNSWYYLNSSGQMVTGTQTIGGKSYNFNSSGVWIS